MAFLKVGLEVVALLPPQGVGRDQLEGTLAFAVDRLQQFGVLAVLLIDAFGCRRSGRPCTWRVSPLAPTAHMASATWMLNGDRNRFLPAWVPASLSYRRVAKSLRTVARCVHAGLLLVDS